VKEYQPDQMTPNIMKSGVVNLEPLASTESCRKIFFFTGHSAAIYRNVTKSVLKCLNGNWYWKKPQ
jgi:hypothetical protein